MGRQTQSPAGGEELAVTIALVPGLYNFELLYATVPAPVPGLSINVVKATRKLTH